MKKVIIVHGWEGNPKSDWYPSVAHLLELKGFVVEIPEMPNSAEPEINAWVNKIKEICPKPDAETCFIGHSIGCQTILRYLEQLDKKIKLGKIILVAPWFNLQGLESEPDSARIAKPWIETPIDFDKVKPHLTSLTTIFSDNDKWVSLSDKQIFKALLDAKIIVEHDKGHFTEEDKVTEFPLIIDEMLKK